MPDGEMMEGAMDEHMMNCDMDCLHKAHKIMKNKPHMKKLHAHAAEKMEAMKGMMDKESPEEDAEEVSSIKDIRKKANKSAKDAY